MVEALRLGVPRVYHPFMGASGRSFDPARPPVTRGPVVDYSLARRALIASVRRGVTATTDVCDAHPELLRAGKNIGEEAPDKCPICSHESLKQVRYVYGDELGRNSGRVVYPPEWLKELAQQYEHFTCYLVEVCTDCHWNHLLRSYTAGSDYPGSERTPQERRRERG